MEYTREEILETLEAQLAIERVLGGSVLPFEVEKASAAAGKAAPSDIVIADKSAKLREIAEELRNCSKCGLRATCRNTVPGEGNPDARLMFIGEAPGEDEDRQGRPFVGRAGKLLDKIIAAMGLKREDVFIANVLKCRPPGNRTPTPLEAATCWKHLKKQIETIRPEVICCLGAPAAKQILNTKMGIGQLRGKWHDYEGIPVMPTYHPAYLLRSYTPENRRRVWDDCKKILEHLGLPVPDHSSQSRNR
jgi:DNA polymerase